MLLKYTDFLKMSSDLKEIRDYRQIKLSFVDLLWYYKKTKEKVKKVGNVEFSIWFVKIVQKYEDYFLVIMLYETMFHTYNEDTIR